MTAPHCPRCGSDASIPDFLGVDGEKTVWTIHRCTACCFSWRDSEPASAIDPRVRAAEFAIDVSEPDLFPIVLRPSTMRK